MVSLEWRYLYLNPLVYMCKIRSFDSLSIQLDWIYVDHLFYGILLYQEYALPKIIEALIEQDIHLYYMYFLLIEINVPECLHQKWNIIMWRVIFYARNRLRYFTWINFHVNAFCSAITNPPFDSFQWNSYNIRICYTFSIQRNFLSWNSSKSNWNYHKFVARQLSKEDYITLHLKMGLTMCVKNIFSL